MSGEILYRPPKPHRCEVPPRDEPGSVWQCSECGAYWRMHSVSLVMAPGWRPMGRLAVWRFRRRQARRG